MDAQRNRQALDRWFRAFNAKQFDELAALLADTAHDDVIQEWPQSGERIRGKDNIMAVLENYPGPRKRQSAAFEAVRTNGF